MKRNLFILALLLITAMQVFAKERNLGMGIQFGDPTGISLKYWTNRKTALTGGIAFGEGLNLQAAYIKHDFEATKPKEGKMPVYYGGGIRIFSEDRETTTGIIGVLGLSYIFPKEIIDIFFEFAPVFELRSDPRFFLTASLGLRYYP